MDSCRICSSNNVSRQFSVKEMMFGSRREYSYRTCNACQGIFIDNIPAHIEEFYPEKYYAFKKIDLNKLRYDNRYIRRINQLNTLLFGKPVYKKWRFYSSNLNRFKFFKRLNVRSDTSVLDVGAGNGEYFLIPLFFAGMKNLYGIDPYLNEDLIYNDELVIKKTHLRHLSGSWDLIVFNHAFEHMQNPLQELKYTNKLLNKNGICIIRIPVASSYCAEKFGENWYQLDAPRHIFIPSEESVKILADKAGFKLYDTIYDATSHQFWVSELYKQNISMSEISEKNITVPSIKKLGYKLKTWYLNQMGQGDQAAFFLRKK